MYTHTNIQIFVELITSFKIFWKLCWKLYLLNNIFMNVNPLSKSRYLMVRRDQSEFSKTRIITGRTFNQSLPDANYICMYLDREFWGVFSRLQSYIISLYDHVTKRVSKSLLTLNLLIVDKSHTHWVQLPLGGLLAFYLSSSRHAYSAQVFLSLRVSLDFQASDWWRIAHPLSATATWRSLMSITHQRLTTMIVATLGVS